jgi:hypothetical protein
MHSCSTTPPSPPPRWATCFPHRLRLAALIVIVTTVIVVAALDERRTVAATGCLQVVAALLVVWQSSRTHLIRVPLP